MVDVSLTLNAITNFVDKQMVRDPESVAYDPSLTHITTIILMYRLYYFSISLSL
jgi:hypothetical protein